MRFSCRSAVTILIAALGFAPGAWAQGCVLCYTSLAASGPTAMRAFEIAMLALLVPALSLFLAVSLLVFGRARTQAPAQAMQKNRVHHWRLSSSAKAVEGRA